MQSKLVLAADVGGTRVKLGVVRGGQLLARGELEARPREGLAGALARTIKTARAICRTKHLDWRRLDGFALAFPGIIEPYRETILSTPAGKFDDAKKLDARKTIADLAGLPVRICNDANAALLGEWRFGAADGSRNAVMMTLGTGIGTAAVIEGTPLRGQHGQAGCLGGHFTLNWQGTKCSCGNLGCAETEASTWALPARARAHPDFAVSRLAHEKVLDYAAVFRAAARHDPVALVLRDRALRVWAGALVNLIHAYDPEVAVIGGGIMRSGKVILPALRRHVAQHAWTPWGRVKIKPAMLGNDAGMLGAASLFYEFP